MSREHVGLRLGLKNLIHSIPLDRGLKYERYMAIGYLPKKDGMDDCVVVGSLEVSRDEEGKEFFNPCKFYQTEKLFEAIIHMTAAYVAFSARRRGVSARQMFFSLLASVATDLRLREKILNLAEGYYKKMEECEGGGD